MSKEVFFSFSGVDSSPFHSFYFECPSNQQKVFLKWAWVYVSNSNFSAQQCIATITDSTNGTPFDGVISDGGTGTLSDNGLFVATSDKVPFTGRVLLKPGTLYQIFVQSNLLISPASGDFGKYFQMILEYE